MPFPDCPQEREDCYLGMQHFPGESFMVNSTCLDVEFARHSWQHVYILSIDTEGFDYGVLNGADKMLSKQAVTFVYFEYHAINEWRFQSLKVTPALISTFLRLTGGGDLVSG